MALFKGLRFFVLAVALVAATACARLSENHGYIPEPSALDEIVVGRDTPETVALVVGRPGTEGLIDESAWFYVRSEYERFLWRAPVETDRQVVAISFAEDGTVSNIERFGQERGRIVTLSRRVTDDNTAGVGFLQQLFSNIGNFSPGQFFGDG